jgi:hypothetical protein
MLKALLVSSIWVGQLAYTMVDPGESMRLVSMFSPVLMDATRLIDTDRSWSKAKSFGTWISVYEFPGRAFPFLVVGSWKDMPLEVTVVNLVLPAKLIST